MLKHHSDTSSIISESSYTSSKPSAFFKFNSHHGVKTEKNHIYFYTEVDRETIRELSEAIRETETYCLNMKREMNLKKVPIYLHINSDGGCIFSAFNAIDTMNSCRVPIYSIIEGSAASAGTLISVCAKKRFIRPNAHMLIHQLSSECWGKMNEIEDSYINLKALMQRIRKVYSEHTSIPKAELKKLLKRDLWLNSDECIENGLVDMLWE
jgi:ATP-dependent Clp endopeptidase proteolytic subunit ClpP